MPKATPMPRKIETVAAGLTKAQRRAVLDARYSNALGRWVIPMETRWDVRVRLFNKGLLGKSACHPLVKLGLAVRDFLKEPANGNA